VGTPSPAKTLAEMVEALPSPKVVWIMVPAGDPTLDTIKQLRDLLSEGDIVIDGGNNKWTEDIAHGEYLFEKKVKFLDCGVSGGIWGLKEGYALMVGGGDTGFVHAGALGAGHFVKMVHNGIEYGMMQAYGEGYELIAATDLVTDPAAVFASWTEGTVIRSWLLDLLVRALQEDPGLEQLEGKADDSGEGRWTVEAAIEHAVPMPAISAALFARFSSRQDDSPAMKVVAALRNQFGGHATTGKGGERSGVLNTPQ
jgi:6-phosphogluconate dehydrogenase